MTNDNAGKFMRVSVELLDMIDFEKQYEMQLAMILLYKGQALYSTWNDTLIDTTASLLIKTFQNNLARGQENNVLSALTDMRDRGLIGFDGDIKFKEEVVINVKPLLDLANSGEVFVELLVQDFYEIMYSDNVIKVNGKEIKAKNGYESLLLQAFLVAKARWNFKTIEYLSQFDDGEIAKDITDDKELQQAKGVFCSDSLDYIRTHKHYSLEEVSAWCDDRYLMAYLEKLEELGCIKIYRKKMKLEDGVWKTHNFYYEPSISDENIYMMVRQYAKRYRYAIKQQEEPKLPKKRVQQDNVFSRRLGRRFR